MRHEYWKLEPIHEWGKAYHAGLSLNFVVLRDIEENEEILIDYDDAWEAEWQKHVQNFVPREHYVPAYKLNKRRADLEIRTIEDRCYENDGVQLWCRAWYIHQFIPAARRQYYHDDAMCSVLKAIGQRLLHGSFDAVCSGRTEDNVRFI